MLKKLLIIIAISFNTFTSKEEKIDISGFLPDELKLIIFEKTQDYSSLKQTLEKMKILYNVSYKYRRIMLDEILQRKIFENLYKKNPMEFIDNVKNYIEDNLCILPKFINKNSLYFVATRAIDENLKQNSTLNIKTLELLDLLIMDGYTPAITNTDKIVIEHINTSNLEVQQKLVFILDSLVKNNQLINFAKEFIEKNKSNNNLKFELLVLLRTCARKGLIIWPIPALENNINTKSEELIEIILYLLEELVVNQKYKPSFDFAKKFLEVTKENKDNFIQIQRLKILKELKTKTSTKN